VSAESQLLIYGGFAESSGVFIWKCTGNIFTKFTHHKLVFFSVGRRLFCTWCRVDGQYLNYDNNPLRTTDFTGLCAAMIQLQAPNKRIGKHSSVGRSSLIADIQLLNTKHNLIVAAIDRLVLSPFLPRDAVHTAALTMLSQDVCPPVCRSRAGIDSNWLNMSKCLHRV